MPIATNVARRGGSLNYYVRVTIPKELRAAFGRREIWKSLETPDRKEAIARSYAVFTDIQRQFTLARRRKKPDQDDLRRAIMSFEWRELEHDLAQRRSWMTERDFNDEEARIYKKMPAGESQSEALRELRFRNREPEHYQRRRLSYETALKKHIATGEIALIQWAADDIIEREGLLLEVGSPEYRALCHELLKVELAALQTMRLRDEGQFLGSGGAEPGPAVEKPTIRSLLDIYVADNPDAVKAETIQQIGSRASLFIEFVGPAATIDTLTRANVRDWKAALGDYPLRAGESKKFRGLGFREVAALNKSLKGPVLRTRTKNKHLSALSGFCDWLRANAYVEDGNPVTGMHLKKDRRSPIRSYSTAELGAVFQSALYQGCQADGKEHLPGNLFVRDHRFWMSLIAMFSGARLGEIVQLGVADMKRVHGQWVFHITEDEDGEKTTKTEGSQRVVPVHSKLVELGILDHREKRLAEGATKLFPEVVRDTRGSLSGYPSRWYGRHLKRIGVKTDRSLNFHSFRHGFIDALRRAGYGNEQIAYVVGHVEFTTTAKYGTEKPGTIAQRVEMVEAIKFDGLDLSHLMPAFSMLTAA